MRYKKWRVENTLHFIACNWPRAIAPVMGYYDATAFFLSTKNIHTAIEQITA